MKRKFSKRFKLFLKRTFILSFLFVLTFILAKHNDGDITGSLFAAIPLFPAILSDEV